MYHFFSFIGCYYYRILLFNKKQFQFWISLWYLYCYPCFHFHFIWMIYLCPGLYFIFLFVSLFRLTTYNRYILVFSNPTYNLVFVNRIILPFQFSVIMIYLIFIPSVLMFTIYFNSFSFPFSYFYWIDEISVHCFHSTPQITPVFFLR